MTGTDPPQQGTAPFAEMDVLWITAGLGCDGDTISITAATQPSLEDILLGGIPWIPKAHLRNPVLAYAVATHGKSIHALRKFPQASLNKETLWRQE
jgi:Ni,Fe-hydrogenase I small subunit